MSARMQPATCRQDRLGCVYVPVCVSVAAANGSTDTLNVSRAPRREEASSGAECRKEGLERMSERACTAAKVQLSSAHEGVHVIGHVQ